jgi:menaquinone-dependent protoporphyrinogen oxidase
MANILIVYGTTEGHTRKIAQRIGGFIRGMGHNAEVVDSADVREDFRADGFNAFIVMGSLHQGNHQRSLVHFVKKHHDELQLAPSAFLSVSLTAAHKEGDHRQELQKCVDQFVDETNWTPTEWIPVAGALMYVEYDWFKRMIMKSISKKAGGDIDTSKDYEYTDWVALEEFVTAFLARSLIFDRARSEAQLPSAGK